MGVILVKVFRVRTLGQHPYSGVGSALPEMQAGAVVVHEKDKKLGGHHTMYARPPPVLHTDSPIHYSLGSEKKSNQDPTSTKWKSLINSRM